MNEQNFLVTVLFLLMAALSPAQLAAADNDRPNFLVILCDDLGFGDLGCYGHPRIKTPNIDKLAADGIRLTDCYASAPVCSSSRAGLMTGRTPTRIGIYDWIPADSPMHLAKSEITVATLLKQADYDTCHVGKWHLNGKFNSPDQPQPKDHGFDFWMATQNNAAPSHENPRNFVRNGTAVGLLEGFSCQLVADEAIRWLKEKRNRKQPFFQFVAFHEPHEPIASPPALVKEYADLNNENKAQHHANITNMDSAVGRLIAALDELDLAENTLVFFTSDNGPETFNRYRTAARSYGSPGELRGLKLWLYEGGIRVPGILRWPAKMVSGRTIHEPISNLDVLPTFCMAQVKPSADRDLDGASFAPIFESKPIARKTPLYWHYVFALGEPRAAMRDGDWMILGKWKSPMPKTVARGKSEPLESFELYNLRTDPKQGRDLAQAMPEKVKELSTMMARKYAEVQAAAPLW